VAATDITNRLRMPTSNPFWSVGDRSDIPPDITRNLLPVQN
jgi:hypothetical protein